MYVSSVLTVEICTLRLHYCGKKVQVRKSHMPVRVTGKNRSNIKSLQGNDFGIATLLQGRTNRSVTNLTNSPFIDVLWIKRAYHNKVHNISVQKYRFKMIALLYLLHLICFHGAVASDIDNDSTNAPFDSNTAPSHSVFSTMKESSNSSGLEIK